MQVCATSFARTSVEGLELVDSVSGFLGGSPVASLTWSARTPDHSRRVLARVPGSWIAHIVGDVAQPTHTDQRDREERVHSSYEDAVDRRMGRYRFNYNGADPASAGRKVRRVARNAHRFYFDLVRTYDRTGFNNTVHRITKRQLNRAANALADLLTSF